ncbi:MAG: SEC-C domain-containing protein [Oligoflexus sp.]|nr:SEC-C domain-containing protein [Oligoflexus sp.]
MFGFLRRKKPTIVQVRSAEEAQHMMHVAIEKGEHFIMEIKEEDFAKMGDFLLPMHQKSKLGRNDPCPCGSGEKYKRCCLRH